MTKHPGRTKAQRRVLDEIGCGNYSPMMAHSTRDALLAAGLIQPLEDKILDSWPFPVRIQQFQMPTPIHMQWCDAVTGEET